MLQERSPRGGRELHGGTTKEKYNGEYEGELLWGDTGVAGGIQG